MFTFQLVRYHTADGWVPIAEWLDELDDVTRGRIAKRIDRLARGLFGDWKAVGGEVFELRIDFGPGYRVYYAREGKTIILLISGGSKSSQVSDIKRAHAYWKDYKTRRR